jgi:serine protease AprX
MVGKGVDIMDRVRSYLHANEVHRTGITGNGVTVVLLDTGICMHPDYVGRIVYFRDFVGGRMTAYDDCSHGSHVSGILGGDGSCSRGRYCGIAPGCRLIHLKVLDRYGQGNLTDIIKAIEWVVRNRDRFDIRIMNLSAGTAKREADAGAVRLVELVEEAWDCGIAVVVAAGNQGPVAGSITVPGNSRKVITVGAWDRHRIYSGCGPTGECVCKPELIAPGTDITSCSSRWQSGRYYTRKSGSSMAAPAIAGSIALLLEREPYLTNVEVKMRLKEAAVDQHQPRNCQGWGMPDLRRLLRL